MEILLGLCLGIALSAASGFRVFIPPLILSIASRQGYAQVSPEFAWITTDIALIVLGIAATVEVLAYFIPVIDNLLDTIEIPTVLAVGTMLSAATLGDEFHPVVKWTIAVVGGGGAAETIMGLTGLTRLGSTAVTAGTGNFLLSTTEALSATVLSILAIFVPILAIIIVIVLLWLALPKIWGWLFRTKKRKRDGYQIHR